MSERSRLVIDDEVLLYTDYDSDTLDAIREALPAMKALYDHLESKMLEAVLSEEYEKMLMYSWRYGELSACYSSLEMLLP